MRGDSTDRREHVLDAMVELSKQGALTFLCSFALGGISRQALYAKEPPGGVKLAPCRLLEPKLVAVRTA